MSASAAPCAGVDVSKDHLDVAVPPDRSTRRWIWAVSRLIAPLRGIWLGSSAVDGLREVESVLDSLLVLCHW